MNEQDKKIKDALQSKMVELDNPDFAQNILREHLAKIANETKYSEFDFKSLIYGLVFIFISINVGILISEKIIEGLPIEHSIMLISLAVIYMIYRLLNEVTTPNITYSQWRGK